MMKRRTRTTKLPRTLFAGALAPALGFAAPLGAQLAPPAATAAATFDGARVTSVEFVGNKSLAEETLLYYLGLEVGEPFSREALDRNIKKLWGRDLVDDLTVEAIAAEGGVKLVIRIDERAVVRSVEYQGLKRVSRKDIDEKLASEHVDLQEGGPLNFGELHRIKTIIEDLYAQKGYRFAQASYQLEPVGENERRVVVTIDEGDRVRIGDIRFEGNTVFGEGRLRWQMKGTKEVGPITRMLKKDIYNPATLAEDLDKVRDLYTKAGYKNVVIGEPRVQVRTEEAGQPGEEPKRQLIVMVPIEEGNRWRFGEVKVEGNTIFKSEGLTKVFRYRPGEWLRSSRVEEGVKAIQEYYQNSGYIQARVVPELVEKDRETADVVVHIAENDQFKVGRIEFQGNSRTRDKVLRRELRIQEGTVLSLGALKNSLLKIRQLGFFEPDEEEPVEFDFKEDNTVDLKFQGKEADRTELQFAAGYQEGLGFFGQFALKTQNFLGRGEQVGINLQSGANADYYEVSYSVPWFLDRPQSLGIQLYSQDYSFDGFDVGSRNEQKRVGGAISYGRSVALFQSASIVLNRYDETGLFRTRNAAGEFENFPFEQEIFSVRPTWVYNTVDNRFEPKSGTNITVSSEYATSFFGGEQEYIRPIASLQLYRTVSTYPLATVFGLNVEAGLIHGLGGNELENFNLFRMGGESSVRGFERNRLLARDEKTDAKLIDPLTNYDLGGDRYFQANLEYHMLLQGPFRLILFADAGNIYAPGQSFDLSRLRYTAGAELRITLPMLGGAPLRFIYAYNLDPKPQDEFKQFVFSIGSTF
jgi:outer membrane protein insertion porin family